MQYLYIYIIALRKVLKPEISSVGVQKRNIKMVLSHMKNAFFENRPVQAYFDLLVHGATQNHQGEERGGFHLQEAYMTTDAMNQH